FSIDGHRLFYIDRAAIERITDIVADADNATPRTVTSGGFLARQIAVHPDGRTLVVSSNRRLFRVDLTTGATTPIPFTATVATPPRSGGRLTIINARVLDIRTGAVSPGMTVEIEQGKIARIGKTAAGATASHDVIDAAGRFLMPGLMDNH